MAANRYGGSYHRLTLWTPPKGLCANAGICQYLHPTPTSAHLLHCQRSPSTSAHSFRWRIHRCHPAVPSVATFTVAVRVFLSSCWHTYLGLCANAGICQYLRAAPLAHSPLPSAHLLAPVFGAMFWYGLQLPALAHSPFGASPSVHPYAVAFFAHIHNPTR